MSLARCCCARKHNCCGRHGKAAVYHTLMGNHIPQHMATSSAGALVDTVLCATHVLCVLCVGMQGSAGVPVGDGRARANAAPATGGKGVNSGSSNFMQHKAATGNQQAAAAQLPASRQGRGNTAAQCMQGSAAGSLDTGSLQQKVSYTA
jgi:hypothetical protein